MARRTLPAFLAVLWLLLGLGIVWAQSDPETRPGVLTPDTIAARKASIRAQLEAFAQSGLEKEELEKARAPFEQMLQMLTALEEAMQKRDAYVAQLRGLPQRLGELEAEQKKLDARPPSRFPNVTQQLHDQIEAQLQATQQEIQRLHSQTATGEARLAAIARALEKRTTEQPQLEKQLFAARSKVSQPGGPSSALSELERLDVQFHLLRAEVEALEAEREWLTRRGPLHDALLRVAQTRLKGFQQDLNTITQALGTALNQQQATLSQTAADLERQLAQTTDPAESLRLQVSLGTISIRTTTAEYQQQLNRLSEANLAQEKRNAREKQDVDRLASLVEKYASGDGVAQRLLVAFERLRRERARYRDTEVKQIEAKLRALTDQLFTLDDRLYEFDHRAERRMNQVASASQAVAEKQFAAEMSLMRKAFEAQKGALREQQQVLTMLVQDQTRLLTLHREHKRLLDDSYHFVLTKMFWLRDGEQIRLDTLHDVVTGAVNNARRLQDFVRAEGARLRVSMKGAVHLWLLALMLFGIVPWAAVTFHRRLRTLVRTSLAACASQGVPPGLPDMVLIVCRAAVWPVYLTLVAWSRTQFLPREAEALGPALVSGVQIVALILLVGLLGRDILRRDGWGQQFWGLSLELCRFLRNLVITGCVAALVFLVPRHILLVAPGEPDITAGSLILARVLLLAFQVVVLVLVSIAGWRSGRLMEPILARSRQQEGLLWRIWPFIYMLVVAVLIAIVVLDILGYRYAAQFVWLRALESLSILLVRRLLLVLLVLRLLHSLVKFVFRIGRRGFQQNQAVQATIDRWFRVAYTICNIFLMVLASGFILEVWGVSVGWLLTSPVTVALLSRALLIALTIGLVIIIIQASKIITEYLLRPRTDAEGATLEVGRKLKTMAPLFQTLLKVGVVFTAALVILEQLNVSTGPILTGVGIFGLAVGFASQSLIKDVINGLFILFEDSISVGDIANLRGIGGQVEKVTLRAITLRSLDGTVHVIPNSAIEVVSNLTKGFSRYLLDVRVSLHEDVDRVINVMREVDEEMRQDPLYRYDMLEPLEVMGLDRFEDSGLIVRARLKTQPVKQWRVGREFNRRMKQAFETHGIQIPFPHRVLYWGKAGDGASLSPPPALESYQPSESGNGEADKPKVKEPQE